MQGKARQGKARQGKARQGKARHVAYNNAFCMFFRLPRDCSASGMFAVYNVTSCPALVRKLVFGVYKRVKASQYCIVRAIRGSDIWWKSSIRANWNKLLYFHKPTRV